MKQSYTSRWLVPAGICLLTVEIAAMLYVWHFRPPVSLWPFVAIALTTWILTLVIYITKGN